MSVSKPTTKRELNELTVILKKYTKDKGLPGFEGKKMRAKLRNKICKEGFTDLDQAWESIHAPPPSEPAPPPSEPEPEEESPQEDP